MDPGPSLVAGSKAKFYKQLLACQQCQKKKKRCDRGSPCTTCQIVGVQCIPVVNQRLPRGMDGGRKRADPDLHVRMVKLEKLLSSLQAKGQVSLASGSVLDSDHVAVEHGAPAHYQYLGSAFWSELGEEVSELGEMLQHTGISDDGEYELSSVDGLPYTTALSPLPQPSNGSLALGCRGWPDQIFQPPAAVRVELCAAYFQSIDPVFKVLHGPTVQAHILNDAQYLDYQSESPALEALSMVLYYASISTLPDDRCFVLFGQCKAEMLAHYGIRVKTALDRADYMSSIDLTTLQSLVIFLAVCRRTDQTRRTWTLMAVAVRSAHALGLHTDKHSYDIFDIEQRRRLWHSICVLDLHLAIEHASDPLILPGTYNTPLPLNIDDKDLYFGMAAFPPPRSSFTDMTFSLMTQDIAAMAVKAHSMKWDAWHKRQAVIRELEQAIKDRYLTYCGPLQPLHSLTLAVGKSALSTLLLHAVRPTKPSVNSSVLPIKGEDMLSLAVTTLKDAQLCVSDRTTESWHWIFWPQWHALAVVLAALRFNTQGELVDRAWPLADAALRDFRIQCNTGQGGQLRRPIEKLAESARQARATSLRHSTSDDNPSVDNISSQLQMPDHSTGVDLHPIEYINEDWLDWENLFVDSLDPMDTNNPIFWP